MYPAYQSAYSSACNSASSLTHSLCPTPTCQTCPIWSYSGPCKSGPVHRNKRSYTSTKGVTVVIGAPGTKLRSTSQCTYWWSVRSAKEPKTDSDHCHQSLHKNQMHRLRPAAADKLSTASEVRPRHVGWTYTDEHTDETSLLPVTTHVHACQASFNQLAGCHQQMEMHQLQLHA